ncbi:DUF262 domain-containing protein [Helicobacter pylori]|uniref:DUF262 domain-containing protein n=1 Tax=Helicobacter pylori TaxID=210 RepID=UPI000EACBF42|nr:DUF262 domain-containing protein [Helicobacter pylori]
MANESIEEIVGKAYKLKDILATELDSYYQIPNYQRPYQWTKENCEKLLDDLFSSYEYYKENDYFCGSLVLIVTCTDPATKAKTYDIVDGQQRLSTFILLAKVLLALYSKDLNKTSRDFLEKSLSDTDEEEKRKRLVFNTIGLNAKDDFENALKYFDDNSHANNNKNNKNNYLKNAIFLKDYLEERKIGNINAFIKWLYFRVTFIKTTCPNIGMALRIFSVLNARGLPLHAIDVFKVELLKKLAKEKDQEEFIHRWNTLRQECSKNESKFPKRKENKREKSATETLFSWYLTYLDPVTGKKNMEERLADQFEKLNKPPLEYLKGVEDFYNAYCEVLEMQDRHAHLLSYLASDYWRVILCTSWLHDYSDKDRDDLKGLLVKFYYQNWVVEQKEPKEQTSCNIIKALKEKKSIKDITSIVKEYLDGNKITQRLKEKLEDDDLYEKHKKSSKNSWLKPILILVEYSMSDDFYPKRIQKDDFHVEHILPQNPGLSSQWVRDFSEEERGLYTHSLANLTLLGGKKNAQASNLDFKEKKEIYMGEAVNLGKDKRGKEKPFKVMTCYDMTKDIALNYTEWTPKNLEKRKEKLIQIIENALKL